ncbi:hypothetical protein [Agrobacterium cavarae]|uniref:hypothetical protein n=1 Tax=Agrobacterium cavarae TaxID=2528239 RepID=UPI00071493A9|nr:hypothetical protein [Agrobacterium cavarae]KQR33960.1 hypothetical protein ASF91_08425 [Rhizobium sp. Leaf155]KQZ92154.1 hypothetical protein ASD74_19760 [Rhizobium sp. Root564]MDP9572894.1 hypothetical protein [Agrobacterium larrymoorei]
MANQGGTHEQHVKAGKQSHKNSDDKATTRSASSKSSADSKSSGKQGGSSEQHMKAGQQSHKNKH